MNIKHLHLHRIYINKFHYEIYVYIHNTGPSPSQYVSHIRQQRPTPRRHPRKEALKQGRNMRKKIWNLHPVKAAGSNVTSHVLHDLDDCIPWDIKKEVLWRPNGLMIKSCQNCTTTQQEQRNEKSDQKQKTKS